MCVVRAFILRSAAHETYPLQVIVTTTINLLVYSLSDPADATLSEKKGKQKQKQKLGAHVDLDLLRTIERPKLPGGDTTAVFRAARYIPNNNIQTLYLFQSMMFTDSIHKIVGRSIQL